MMNKSLPVDLKHIEYCSFLNLRYSTIVSLFRIVQIKVLHPFITEGVSIV